MEYPVTLLDDKENSDTVIVAFSGNALKFGLIPVFEFYNFLNKHFPQYSKHFYIDTKIKHFHYGISNMSDSVESTVEYLRGKIQNYKNVVFMGVSSGGYAAILYGSLLNVSDVISFIPQTILRGEGFNDNYRNLKPYINNITNYHIYGDPCIKNKLDCHHMSHCYNIEDFDNVVIWGIPHCVEMSTVRNSGQLFDIISGVLEKIKN